ncbi:MAG: FRG domain-containing protein [Gammaproteobacteria bacterium]
MKEFLKLLRSGLIQYYSKLNYSKLNYSKLNYSKLNYSKLNYSKLIKMGNIGINNKELFVSKTTGELCNSDGSSFTIDSFANALELVSNIKKSKKLYPDTKIFNNITGNPIDVPLPPGFNLFFRGQTQDYPLIPGVFRSCTIKINEIDYEEYYDEASIFNEAYSVLLSETEKKKSLTKFQQLAIMQHFGLPTRLLDWTKKFSVALYFALSDTNLVNSFDNQHIDLNISKNDAYLYILDAMRLNELTKLEGHVGIATPKDNSVLVRAELTNTLLGNKQELEKLVQFIAFRGMINPNNNRELNEKIFDSLKLPVALLPTQFEDRIRAQNACFTIHGGKKTCNKKNPEKEYSLQNFLNYNNLKKIRNTLGLGYNNVPILFKVKIPWDKKYQIKEDLVDNIGMDDGSLFLDRGSYAGGIKRKWKFFKPVSNNSNDDEQNSQANTNKFGKNNGH